MVSLIQEIERIRNRIRSGDNSVIVTAAGGTVVTGPFNIATGPFLVGGVPYTPMFNPMTTPNDIIIGGASGAPTRMAKGNALQYLRVNAANNALEYGALPVDPGFANPMTTTQDLIVGGVAGAPTRLAKGTNGQYLRVNISTGLLEWGNVNPHPYLDLTKATLPSSPAAGDTRFALDPDGMLWGITSAGISFPAVVNKNLLQNAGMRINQRGLATLTTVGKIVDRWVYATAAGLTYVCETNTALPSTTQLQAKPAVSLQLRRNASGGAVVAGSFESIRYTMEGNDARALIGQPFVVSFWVLASRTGTYGFSCSNLADRTFVTSFTINAASTWERKIIFVPAESTGTWTLNTGAGMRFDWMAICGTSYQTSTLNAWQSSIAVFGPNTMSNTLMSLNDALIITAPKIEPGILATPFDMPSMTEDWANCLRQLVVYNASYVSRTAADPFTVNPVLIWPVRMRGTPTVSGLSYNGGTTNGIAMDFLTDFSARYGRYGGGGVAWGAGTDFYLTAAVSAEF